jgi:hypothetical protein
VPRTITAGVGVALCVSTAFATGALAGGNGAARSGLSPTSGSTTSGQCVQGSGAGGNGFAILNAPGRPGAAFKLIGEVALQNATPDTTYTVNVSVAGSNKCMPEGVIDTNGVGNGNAHLADSSLGSGSFYVVIQDATGNEVFASGPLSVN